MTRRKIEDDDLEVVSGGMARRGDTNVEADLGDGRLGSRQRAKQPPPSGGSNTGIDTDNPVGDGDGDVGISQG